MGGKRWTKKDLERLKVLMMDHTATEAAKILGRSRNSVIIKLSRENIGGFEQATDLLMMNQVVTMLGTDRGVIKRNWIPRGLKFFNVGHYVVCEQDKLISFLKKNPDVWNAANVVDDTLLSHYDWYWQKRKQDTKRAFFWDEMQVFKLRMMYRKGCKFKEIAKAVGKSEHACVLKVKKLRNNGDFKPRPEFDPTGKCASCKYFNKIDTYHGYCTGDKAYLGMIDRSRKCRYYTEGAYEQISNSNGHTGKML